MHDITVSIELTEQEAQLLRLLAQDELRRDLVVDDEPYRAMLDQLIDRLGAVEAELRTIRQEAAA